MRRVLCACRTYAPLAQSRSRREDPAGSKTRRNTHLDEARYQVVLNQRNFQRVRQDDAPSDTGGKSSRAFTWNGRTQDKRMSNARTQEAAREELTVSRGSGTHAKSTSKPEMRLTLLVVPPSPTRSCRREAWQHEEGGILAVRKGAGVGGQRGKRGGGAGERDARRSLHRWRGTHLL